MSCTSAAATALKKKKAGCLQGLLHDNLQTDSEAEDDTVNTPGASSEPWKVEFKLYLATVEARLGGIDIIEWWGVCEFIFYT